ncbi:MAG: tetratricopeptide repeat protein [Victivallaceae bacterium]|nr:tetratricopeptide repeat protein [Victivallaceae bacterium]
MEKQAIHDVHVSVRDMYKRALACADDPKNRDYAITLLSEVVRRAPALEVARKKLRELELAKKPGFFAKLAASSSSRKALPAIQSEMTQSPLRALALCEAELAKNLNNPAVLRLMAAAARALKAEFIEIEAMELLHEFLPADMDVSKSLAELYKQAGMLVKRAELLTVLANKNPGSYELQDAAKLAMNDMKSIREEEKLQAMREKMSATKANVTLQLEGSTIHDERQARTLISKFTAELAAADSLDMRRKLAEAYMVAKEYDNAIKQLEYVAQKLGTADPALDKAIEQGYVAKFDAYIDALKANPDDYENAAQQIEEYSKQRDEFRLQRAENRLKLYPNDSQLQFDYAALCYAGGRINEAVEYFEEAAKSQRLKVAASIYLGRCAIRRRDYDAAIERLNIAIKELLTMDKRKLEALYYLGMAYERANRFEEAKAQYDLIQNNHPGYRDVEEHIALCKENL